MSLKRELGLGDLVMLNVVAIVGPRWLGRAAHEGPSSLVLWGLAILLFFGPQVFAVLELSRRYPEEGGLYRWTKRAFGPAHGFVSGWCYWTNNVTYFATLLATVAGGLAFLSPGRAEALGEQGWFVCGLSLVLLWLIAGLNIAGLRPEKRLHMVGAWATWIPVLALLVLAGIGLATSGSATPMTRSTLTPSLSSLPHIQFFSLLCFAMAGFEMAPSLAGEIRDPSRTIPRATWISGILIATLYIAGTASLLVAIPASEVESVSGIVQGVQRLGDRFGIGWSGAAAGVMIAIAGAAGVGAWMAGCSRVAYATGVERALPRSFGAIHPRFGTPHLAILWVAGISTLVIGSGLFADDVEGWYDQMNSVTTLVYFIPYLYLFLALPVLGIKDRDADARPRSPVRSVARVGISAIGFLTTLVACLLAVVPGPDVKPDARFGHVARIVGGVVLFVGSGIAIYAVARRRDAASGPVSAMNEPPS